MYYNGNKLFSNLYFITKNKNFKKQGREGFKWII
jgi:hypothetical protein